MDRTYEQLIPELLELLFEPGELVRLAVGSAAASRKLERDACIAALLPLRDTPNIWFSASAFTPGTGNTSADCLRTRALCLDMEWQSAVHPKAAFSTRDDLYAYLRTLPLQPSAAWETGHGVQALYVLEEPLELGPGGEPGLDACKRVWGRAAKLARADAAISPEHLWRVPLTVNAKPGHEAVRGSLVWWKPGRRVAWRALRDACERYDIPEPEPRARPAVGDPDGIDCPYEELPEALRDEIETYYPQGGGTDRSALFHMLAGRLARAGYSDRVIEDALGRGRTFREKYGRRLGREVRRSLGRIRASAPYGGTDYVIELPDAGAAIELASCRPVRGTPVGDRLERYRLLTGAGGQDIVEHATRFCEHVLGEYDRAVVETPCGAGKSTWALCHIAAHAGPGRRHLYVVETVDKLYAAAKTLEELNPGLDVGRAHGFHEGRCFELCGVRHTWRECYPVPESETAASRSACARCPERERCMYFTRQRQLGRDAVVLTHNGFIRLVEQDAPELKDTVVIVDESLDLLQDEAFAAGELQRVRPLIESAGIDPATLFPGTAFACLRAGEPGHTSAFTFAAQHYVYRTAAETREAVEAAAVLRRTLRTATWNAFNMDRAEYEQAVDVAARITHFFRGSQRMEAAYALTEDNTGIILRKRRFDIGADLPVAKLLILNASAALHAGGYPAGVTVCTCPDLPHEGHRLILHVIQGNPTHTRRLKHTDEMLKLVRDITPPGQHKHILLATDKNQPGADELLEAVRKAATHEGNPAVDVTHLERGGLRGTNEAGDCSLACVASMALFTRIPAYALATSLHLGRTIPREHVIRKGKPYMPGRRARFTIPAMQAVYTLSALDELYQALWRSCLRNGRQAEAIVALPDPEWMTLLWRTVMPGLWCAGARQATGQDDVNRHEPGFDGLSHLLHQPTGTEIPRNDAARILGYHGKEPWREAKDRIVPLLAPFFEIDSTRRPLRRK